MSYIVLKVMPIFIEIFLQWHERLISPVEIEFLMEKITTKQIINFSFFMRNTKFTLIKLWLLGKKFIHFLLLFISTGEIGNWVLFYIPTCFWKFISVYKLFNIQWAQNCFLFDIFYLVFIWFELNLSSKHLKTELRLVLLCH